MSKLLAFIALLVVSMGVRADGDDDPACTICQNVVKDFTPEITSSSLQTIFDRLCDDLTGTEFKDYDQTCKESVDGYFDMIKLLLSIGDTPKDICNVLGACGWSSALKERVQQRIRTSGGLKGIQARKMLQKV